MQKKEIVVVFTPLQKKQTADGRRFAIRMRELGLTAYGASNDETWAQLKKMFATWVGLHRNSGTLENALNRSNLRWCYQSDYDGTEPYELVLAGGDTRVVPPKKSPPAIGWREEKTGMRVAH